jgi:hypothetical protein
VAWYERTPGADEQALHVRGTCGFESSGFRSWLEPRDEFDEDPERFVLHLMVERPAGSDTAYVERELTWSGPVGDDVKRVSIRGEARAEVEVGSAPESQPSAE